MQGLVCWDPGEGDVLTPLSREGSATSCMVCTSGGSEEDIHLGTEAGCHLLGTITQGVDLLLPKHSLLLRSSIPHACVAPPETIATRTLCFLEQTKSNWRES